ncbi:54S ribosomal protein L6-like protein [Hapsidospora chrysogenum ATCC 11550]|uniref:54S ribosomal protein L6-like protein n=1 Tax=Hapsidospora chrysogenum (strain ATCC 11550 / CBS 779.69 / DSM 880 / IAM 14645 / JCM 23072 / IMI 49137) TaxID=857340 RepID=A0A086T9C4_HAPC1|nr:54S ribosomal protein L6-like protein [Hapsidospora chrysogenum ATCC 11550]
MFAPCRGKALRHAISSSPAVTLPRFLVPAWQTTTTKTTRAHPRQFSTTPRCHSKLGRTPISIPPGVELTMGEPKIQRGARDWKSSIKRTITVKGPLGELELEIPDYVKMEQDPEARTATLSILNVDEKQQHEMWGTSWAYLNNSVMGVSEGHSAILRLVGVGYRASVEQRGAKQEYPGQQFLCLKLGFTHPVEEGIPQGLKVTTPAPTRILIEGIDKETIMSFAGRIKQWRKPEPYKGKGIFINEETIKLKSKKIS